jgi:integrase
MPQKRKPPRLWLRNEDGRNTWVIKDAGRSIRTGCGETEIAEAERKLGEYIAGKYEAPRGGRASEIAIGDVILVYDSEKADDTAKPSETRSILARLNEFMGDRPVSDIRGKLCREYAEHRGTRSGARRDLEAMRAAVNYYHKEYGLDVLPAFTLPEKSTPRERYLTRKEAALLLWAALGWEKQKDGTWKRRRDQKRTHLARLILIGIYTGTRPGAVLKLQWIRSTTGGWVDLERGVIFRRADGERVAHNKRKTPVKIAPRLLAHLKRWHRIDSGIRHVVHYLGNPVTKPNKAFRSAIAAAGLDKSVTPHVLRHTRGTWLAEVSVEPGKAAASLGLTVDEYERTYLHNDPRFQAEAANAY